MNNLFFLHLLIIPLSAVNFENRKVTVPLTPDTIACTISGKTNRLHTDSLMVDTSAEIFTPLLNGTITQKGLNNTIEINTGVLIDSTTQKGRNKVSITQTGRNNSIKINSQGFKKQTKHSIKTNKK